MAKRYSPVTVRPHDGGHLMTVPSSENAGLANYTVKRDWRRILDAEGPREGHDYFWPNLSGSFASNPGNQPFPLAVTGDAGPINLIHWGEREDGHKALIVGTPTRLYRFLAMEDGDYWEHAEETPAHPDRYAYDSDADDPGPALGLYPYVDHSPGEWICINPKDKDGEDILFSASGKRWEAVNIGGYTVINNGVDLPVTYRLHDLEVKPIYELRELGYARFGTIAEFEGVLMLGDVSEIQSDRVDEWFDPLTHTRSGAVMASQTATTVTSTSDFFSAADVGKTIVFTDGTTATIAAYVAANEVTVSENQTVELQTFKMRVTASQAGSTFSELITGSITGGAQIVTASSNIFTVAMEGRTLRFVNGWSATITSPGGYIDPTHVSLDTAAPETFTSLPFHIIDPATDYIVTADADCFTSDMEGLELWWDNGEQRQITNYISATQVEVDGDLPVASGLISVENESAYGNYTEDGYVNRYQYRLAWSMNDNPRRYGTIYAGTIAAGSNVLLLSYPVKSLSIGDEIQVAGAGEAGGNLTGTVLYLAANQVAVLNVFAAEDTTDADGELITTFEDALVRRTQTIGSIAGYKDLVADSSAILKMAKLGKVLVIYKDQSIVLARYSGIVLTPFAWEDVSVPAGKTLYYRHTLCTVGESFHVFAGRNALYRFDLTDQIPREIAKAEWCKNIFFDETDIGDTEDIFAADNAITKEVFFVFPATGDDKALIYDHLNDEFCTTGVTMTAAATVPRPAGLNELGESEHWFLMALSTTLVQYGLAHETVPAWSAKEIWYRRSAKPYSATKYGYESILKCGLSDFGDPFNEKHLRSYVPHLASDSPTGTVTVTLYGGRNVQESPSMLVSETRTDLHQENLFATHYLQHCFADELKIPATVSGSQYIGGRPKIAARTFEGRGIDSRSFTRRPT